MPGTVLGGRYKLIEQLSAGGFGQTFIAEDLHLPGNPRCVLKRLQPQVTDELSLRVAKRLFDTEAQVLYQLGHHDQIPRLLAHFEHEQEFYLAQELVVGEPLTKELIAGQRWAEDQVVTLLQDLLGILTFVHQQDVIHRDVKPANLMRRQHDRRIVLIDFGAVKQVSTQVTHSNLASAQTISIGTPGYVPNEQLAGTPRFSSDVYAVGMLGIQALTGMSPKSLSEDPHTGEIQWREFAVQVSAELAAVLDKMIRYDFRVRYARAGDALTAIEQMLTAHPHRQPAIGLTEEPTVRWDTEPSNDSYSPSLSDSPPANRTTKPSLSARVPPLPTVLDTIRLPALTQLKRLEPRKLVLPLVGLAALSGLVVFLNASPKVSNQADSKLSRVASPSPSPDSEIQAAALLTQANQLREQKQFQLALNRYNQSIALNANSPEAHWGRCYSLNVLKKFTEAIAACDAALKLNPNYAEAMWSKGYAFDSQQKDQQALALYEQATVLKPDLAEAWNNKGTALLQLNRPSEAVAAFDQATRLKPNLVEAWNSRGVALWNLGRYKEAIASIDRAIQIQPSYQPALGMRERMRQRLRG